MEASEKNPQKRHWMVRVLLSKSLIIAVALVVAYTLAGFFLAPYLIHRYAVRFAEESLKCRLAIEKIRLNPYALTLGIENFDLKEANGAPLVAFKEFFVDLQTSSLWRWAVTFADVRLENPSLNIEIMPDGGVNLIDLLDRIPKDTKPDPEVKNKQGEDEAPLRVILEHIALNQGQLVFTDLSDATHASVTIEPLDLELKNVTTLPDRKGRHSFEATLPHGGRLRWTGEMSIHPIWSEGDMELKDFSVATAWEFLQDEILIEKPKGKVAISANYRFSHSNASDSLLIDGIKVLISGLSVSRAGTTDPVFAMDAIRLDEGRFDLASRELSIGQLALSRGSVSAAVDDQGRLSFQELFPVNLKSGPVTPKKETRGQPPWQIDLKSIALDGVSMKYIDHSRSYPTEMGAGSLDIDLQAHLSYGPEKMQATLEGADITLSGVSLKEIAQGDTLVHLNKLFVQGGRLDLEARQLDVARVSLDGGHALLVKEKDGAVNLARVLGGVGKGKVQKEVEAIAKEAKDDMKPWAFKLGSAEMSGFGVAFSDQGLSPAPTMNLDNLALKATDIQSDFKSPVPFDLSVTVRQGGSMNARGRVKVNEKSAEASIQLSNLALTPVQPYLAQVVFLTLDSGALSLKGNVTHTEDQKGPHTQFAGNLDIQNLLVSESGTGKPFLSWKEMKVNDMNLSLTPDRLEVGEVRLKGLYGKVIIYEDQSISLKKVPRPQEAKPKSSQPPPSQTQTPGGFPVNVKKIQIDKSGLDFADLSLRPQFAAKIHELKGAIVGLSTKEGQRTQVQLDGRVDDYGSSKIRGELETFNPKRFTDLSVTFRNVEMTNLTPYSAKFAGYRIASGKLSLDLRYLIKNSELQGENQIILDKLTLGEKVDNPDAPDLPLELALALLRDSEGRIDIGLPVSGNIDDPQFTYGHLIWKALLNLFKKIITAPFRALSAMLGVDDEKLDLIEFEPGKTLLSPPEQEKVKNLSEALSRRPQLTLKIQAGYDPANDGAALKSAAVKNDIAKKMGKKATAEEEPEPVDVNDPQTQKAIDELVVERLSPQVLATAKEEAAKRAAEASKKGEKQASAAAVADGTRDLYGSLLQKLLDAYPVAEAQLRDLGQKRAEVVKQALVAAGKVDGARITILEPAVAEEKGEQGIGSKLSLDVAH